MINKLIVILSKIFVKNNLDLNCKLWKTETCYKCGKDYNKKKFWTIFVNINNTTFQVPICDDCSGTSIKEVPTNK